MQSYKFKIGDRVIALGKYPGQVINCFESDCYVVRLDREFRSPVHSAPINRAVHVEFVLSHES